MTKPGKTQEIRTVDLFCGAGGSSWGARSAGAKIVAGFDCAADAATAYQANFPEARFFLARLEDLDPEAVAREIGPVDLMLASPECRSHSPAKGNAPRCEASRMTALQVPRFARVLRPRWILLENVVSMRRWERFNELRDELAASGYAVSECVVNAADFGVPQTRRRLFLLCDRERKPRPIPRRKRKRSTASSIVQLNGTHAWTPLKTPRRAANTLARAKRAQQALGFDTPFLLVYYGSDGGGGWQSLDRPLRTVTTLDRFAIVKRTGSHDLMRMLQVEELLAAMGMPARFVPGDGTRRSRIRAIGNAVCPPVVQALVKHLVGRTARAREDDTGGRR